MNKEGQAQKNNFPENVFDGLLDEPRNMVHIPRELMTCLKDYDKLECFRDILRTWYTSAVDQYDIATDSLDVTLFIALDRTFAALQRPALQVEIQKSNNIKKDS